LLVVPDVPDVAVGDRRAGVDVADDALAGRDGGGELVVDRVAGLVRSEEHTSELQSQSNLVCRLLLEKKKCSRHCSSACSRRWPCCFAFSGATRFVCVASRGRRAIGIFAILPVSLPLPFELSFDGSR